MLADQKERRAELKQHKLNIPLRSERTTKAVGIGFIYERLAPTLEGFTFNKNDCRSMFDPIDYVIFEGLSEKKKVDKIIFMDVKSGKARLSAKQRTIKRVVEDKKVQFRTYKSSVTTLSNSTASNAKSSVCAIAVGRSFDSATPRCT